MVDVGGLWQWVWADFGFLLILDFSYGGRWVVGWLVDFGFWLWLSAVGNYGQWWWWCAMGSGGGGLCSIYYHLNFFLMIF